MEKKYDLAELLFGCYEGWHNCLEFGHADFKGDVVPENEGQFMQFYYSSDIHYIRLGDVNA